jgi:hypothetical protein
MLSLLTLSWIECMICIAQTLTLHFSDFHALSQQFNNLQIISAVCCGTLFATFLTNCAKEYNAYKCTGFIYIAYIPLAIARVVLSIICCTALLESADYSAPAIIMHILLIIDLAVMYDTMGMIIDRSNPFLDRSPPDTMTRHTLSWYDPQHDKIIKKSFVDMTHRDVCVTVYSAVHVSMLIYCVHALAYIQPIALELNDTTQSFKKYKLALMIFIIAHYLIQCSLYKIIWYGESITVTIAILMSCIFSVPMSIIILILPLTRNICDLVDGKPSDTCHDVQSYCRSARWMCGHIYRWLVVWCDYRCIDMRFYRGEL